METGELLLVIGPPAVGKMSVGRAICERSDFRLFHNHMSIEPLLGVFDHGTPEFERLNTEIRRRVIAEAAAVGTRLVFSFVWGVDLDSDAAYVTELVAPYATSGRRVAVVELSADLETRLVRNVGADRLAAKPSKRDLEWSETNLRELELSHRMNTDPDRPSPADAVIAGWPHLHLDTSTLGVDETAEHVLAWLTGI